MIITLANIDPNIISIGPIAIRWYSLAYIAGILFAWFLIKSVNKKKPIMSKEAWDDWLFWAVIGIILGGRLGYVLFYNFGFYFQHPWQILAVWQGGMSFHGGLIGAIAAMFLFAKKYKINFLELTDILAIAAPIGLFFGRVANFVNMELYGRVTNSNFGVIFPNAGNLPRHPSQLYEAALEGLLLFLILFCLSKFTKIKEIKGFLSGLFLIGYGSARIFAEQFRQPDEQIGFLFSHLSMGQILSVPLIIFGLVVAFVALKKNVGKVNS
ncbi:MAG: phosphatidylglycerol:prolipoprotein diacylglycerol transferase [Rickettsiales bacterium]|jgi:phosphatidylglycerol:prolipoprotein diacylglycerol transferase